MVEMKVPATVVDVNGAQGVNHHSRLLGGYILVRITSSNGAPSNTCIEPDAANTSDSPKSPDKNTNGPPALLLLGNAGAGKSTLLAQLGGKFDSGAKFRRGFTKDISEELVKVNGEDVRLIDVPGLFEPSNKETQLNAQKLNEALLLGHSYRICFVLKAGNRGPDDAEMVMMSKISECVRKSDGSKLSFGMIVNQIPSEEVGDMYKELAKDNFRSMFDGLSIPGFTFDINIDSVIMLPFNELELEQNKFRDTLAEEILKHPAVAIELENDISFCNNDLKRYQTALLNRVGRAILPSRPLVGSRNLEIFRNCVHIAQKATKAVGRIVVNRTRD
ncbi:hypothetical protein MVEG_00082 [Podila verticillata NRRL 6337]|nr:hypothetical protein MVEG_00082 [Podila verticillata NRRL 6337]